MGNTFWAPSCQPELYHHGIKGQKWGVRRYQPYGAGDHVKGGKFVGDKADFTRALNKTENENAKFKYYSARAKRKSVDAIGSARKAKFKAKAKEYDKALKKGEDEVNRLLKDAKSSGYKVNSYYIKSVQGNGRRIARMYLGGILPAAGYELYKGHKYGYDSVGYVDSKLYTVEDRSRR